MAQFGGAKNPPWARTAAPAVSQAGTGLPMGTQILSQPGIATPTVFSLGATATSMTAPQYTMQQLSVIQQQQAAAAVLQAPAAVGLPQPGVAMPTSLASNQVGTVSYPAPRATGAQQAPKQRVFTGSVTKLHDNFGFVDEDVFFQTTSVKGTLPRVGDRVLVEASYNANMPFKWNATRIQVLPNQVELNHWSLGGVPKVLAQTPNMANGMGQPQILQQQQQAQQAMIKQAAPGITPSITPSQVPNLSQPPPPLMGQQTADLLSAQSNRQQQSSQGLGSSRPRSERFDREAREPRDRGNRDSHRAERKRSRSPRKRSRSPRRRSRSPVRTRSPPRRRANRIVPRYMVQIPKLMLDTSEACVMMLKQRYQNLYVPSDFFQSTFSWVEAFPTHRTLQLGNHCAFHVAHKEVDALAENNAILEPPDADHLYSAKVMLLSSPSLEDMHKKSCALAQDPAEAREAFQHPTRLLQFLVGLKGKSEPMAIGGPWSPSLDGPNPGDDPRVLIKTAIRTTHALTGIDLSVCTQWYRFTEIHYHRPEETHKGRLVPARIETVVIFLPDVWSCQPTRMEWDVLQTSYRKQLHDKIAEETNEDAQEEDGEDAGAEEGPKDPTHHSELDPKTMKVNELRRELEARTMSSKGLKSQLIARLMKAVKFESDKESEEKEKKEQEEEQEKDKKPEKMEVDEKEDEEKKKKEDEEKKRRDEREKAARERRYQLPDNPAIIVHPSTTAKSGKFDCSIMSLSVLLDYRPEDNKEHSFEVSLFAELFNEMLMRDFGFRIYKGLLAAPDLKKEEEEQKKKEKEKEKKEKEEKEKEKDKDKRSSKEKDTKSEPSAKKAKTDDDKDSKEKDAKDEASTDKKEEKESKKDDEKEEKKDKDRRRDRDRNRSKDRDRDRDTDRDSKKKDKVKYETVDPALLLAFVYFDQTHTGYLMDKDVEEILHTLGLLLSRSQVKKLVQKLVSRDTLSYRKITDKPIVEVKKVEEAPVAVAVEKEEEKDKDKEKEKEEKEEPTDTKEEGKTAVKQEPGTSPKKEEPFEIPPDDVLSQGNKPLLSKDIKPEATTGTPTRSRRIKKEKGEAGDAMEDNSGMVLYNGSTLDIGSVLSRLEKSENSRKAIESKLQDTQTEMDDLKNSFSSSEQNSQKVALELQELKKKLRDQRRATDTAESNSKKYHSTLSRSLDVLQTMVKDVKSTLEVKEVKENGDA